MAGNLAFMLFHSLWYDFIRLSKGEVFLGGTMTYIFILLSIAAILLLYMLKEAFANRVCYHDFHFTELPGSFGEISIFFISDIHRRKISKRILTEVMGKADAVIIGGDLTEKKVPMERVRKNLEDLKKIAPVYFVWGNNDYEVNHQLLNNLFAEVGVKVLLNKVDSWESTKEGDYLHLIGIDDIVQGHAQLDIALEQIEKRGFRILLSHNPEIMDVLRPEHEIHLVLSGHTHGGQIRIFGFGPYEKGGIKKIGQTILFISNGYGTTALPLRLGARAETHLISIKPRA